MQNPIEESMQYGLTLLAAHNSLVSEDQRDSLQSMKNCIKLLGGSKDASYEVNELIRAMGNNYQSLNSESGVQSKSEINKETSASLLQDHLGSACDVASLVNVRKSLKQGDTSKEVKKILNHIDDSLKHVANIRRKNITIEEFIKNDSNINYDVISKIADTVLKEKTTKVAERMTEFQETGVNIKESDLLDEDVKQMLSEHMNTPKQRFIDPTTLKPYYRIKSKETQINDKIQGDIERASSMSEDLEFTRAKFENELLKMFTFRGYTKEQLDDHINQWIELRLIDFKSKPEYNLLYDSEFKHLMLDKFRQNIISELGLDNFEDWYRDFETYKHYDKREIGAYKNDIANKNNLNEIMDGAVGYDRLVERLQAPENSPELAQSNFFEKLLAEYYVEKRQDYKVSKEMLKTLDKTYNSRTFVDQKRMIGRELEDHVSTVNYPQSDKEGLLAYHRLSNINKEELELRDENKPRLVALGDATNSAIQGETMGVSEELAKYTYNKPEWPTRLEKFDIRRTPKEWVEEKLQSLLTEMFEKRYQVPTKTANGKAASKTLNMTLSRNELKAFDEQIASNLNKKNMILRLLQSLDEEYAEFMQVKQDSKFKKQIEIDAKVQSEKAPNTQDLANRHMKNEEAAYKLIAYRIAQQYHPHKDVPKPAGAFIYYYENILKRDIQQLPRPIENEKYLSRKERNELPEDVYDDHFIDWNNLDFDEGNHQPPKESRMSIKDVMREHFSQSDNGEFFDPDYKQ